MGARHGEPCARYTLPRFRVGLGCHGGIHLGVNLDEMNWVRGDHAGTCTCPECTGEPCEHGCTTGECPACELDWFGELTVEPSADDTGV